MPTATLSTSHPGWQRAPNGGLFRLLRSGSGMLLAAWDAGGLAVQLLHGTANAKPSLVTADPADLPASLPPQLADALHRLGPVQHLANPWLWDALTAAILRQVVRAEQGRERYRRWCQQHGPSRSDAHGTLALPPAPETVLALPNAAFAASGIAFCRATLQAAATAYLRDGPEWAALPPARLPDALTAVPGIGPWTARTAAADHTGDHALYPHGDLAVRTRARTAAPDHPWPTTARAFERTWRSWADAPHQLHALTLLILTWSGPARP